jgi:hypothetical protein
LNPPQRGLGVISKSSRPQDKIVCVSLLIIYLLITFPRN